jgi:hypothetical protein
MLTTLRNMDRPEQPIDESPVLDDSAASLAEALSISEDDEERIHRIHYLIDEAFPPDPAVRKLQEPDEARLAVWAMVPHVDQVSFGRRWTAIARAAELESAFALDLSSTRWVWADASELIVDQADFISTEPADRSDAGPGSAFRSEDYTDALREAWSQRRSAEVRALVAADRGAMHPAARWRTDLSASA